MYPRSGATPVGTPSLHTEPLAEELFLSCLGMDKHDIGIPATPGIKGLTGALGDHLYINTVLALNSGRMCLNKPECSVEVVEETTIDFSSA